MLQPNYAILMLVVLETAEELIVDPSLDLVAFASNPNLVPFIQQNQRQA